MPEIILLALSAAWSYKYMFGNILLALSAAWSYKYMFEIILLVLGCVIIEIIAVLGKKWRICPALTVKFAKNGGFLRFLTRFCGKMRVFKMFLANIRIL